MKKTFILLTAVLLAAAFLPLYAQRIAGTVADAKGQAVEAATVTLFRSADSSKVGTTTTDKAGHFAFDRIPAGKYLLSASSVGYSTVWSLPIDNSKPGATRTVPPIILASPVVANLKEMTIVAKKPFIEQKPDRTIINVDASPTNAGSTVMDVLEKSPGVTLDKDDNISLKGKGNVMVMIDGKPTYLSPAQLASYLRSLPASAIDQIELMTNPSAKYDAAGNSGIINIKTKKNKTKGFNGSTNLTYSQGVYPKPSGSVNLNYRDGKTNFFLNGSYSHWEGFHDLDINRKYLDADEKTINSIFLQQTQIYSTNPVFTLKLGMDYYLTPKTTLGFVVSGFRDKEEDHTSSNIMLLDPQYNLDSIVNSPSTNKTTWKNGAVNLNFRHSYDSAGRELTADLDYVRYGSVSDQYFDNLTYSPAMIKLGESILTGHLPSTINIYTAKTDYTRPLNDGYKLETGLKLSYVNTDNAAD
jgi:iron complex outermembrane recepter protein